MELSMSALELRLVQVLDLCEFEAGIRGQPVKRHPLANALNAIYPWRGGKWTVRLTLATNGHK
jgi:hypothetical protein